jgi:hypothetical protein
MNEVFSGQVWSKIALDILRREGVVKMQPFPPEIVKDIVDHLWEKRVFNAHVVAKATEIPVTLSLAVKEKRWPMMCHLMEDVVTAPYLFEMALAVLPMVQAYFGGERPCLYSMNAFWTQPSDSPQYADTHWWHRDGDDRKQLALFMYGTNVLKSGDGSHLYQRGTHKIPDNALTDMAGNPRLYTEPVPEALSTVIGPAGTLFFSDPSGLHMGLRPQGLRMLAWMRFGVSFPPPMYIIDGLMPVDKTILGSRYPADPTLQEQIQLVVR